MEKEDVMNEEFEIGNISLILTSYNDIFSSFDSRPYSEKALSVDFLSECKRAVIDKNDKGLELVLSIPRAKRNINDELRIKKRLREHFHRHFLLKDQELERLKKTGIRWVLLGVIILLALLSGMIVFEENKYSSLLAVFEVPCWFLIWEGMGKILFESKEYSVDKNFYSKMTHAEILFKSY